MTEIGIGAGVHNHHRSSPQNTPVTTQKQENEAVANKEKAQVQSMPIDLPPMPEPPPRVRDNPAGFTECLGSYADNPDKPRSSGDVIFVMMKCECCEGKGVMDDEKCEECNGTGKTPDIEAEYKVSPFEYRLKAQFEQWVRKGARRAIAEAAAQDGEEEANAMRSVYQADLGAGKYNWDGEYVSAAMGKNHGILQMLYLALKRCNAEMTETKAREIFDREPLECIAAVRWSLGNGSDPAGRTGGAKKR